MAKSTLQRIIPLTKNGPIFWTSTGLDFVFDNSDCICIVIYRKIDTLKYFKNVVPIWSL